MLTWARHLCVAALTCAVYLGAVQPAAAQFRYVPTTGGYSARPYYRAYNQAFGNRYPAYTYNPVYSTGFGSGMPYNPYISGADPYGGYLNGAANMTMAQGQYMIDSQKAYLMKEQVRGAQMDNRRRAYDEWLYERANTPSLNDERERIQKEDTRRAKNRPPATEIWSGTSLNQLLDDIQQLQAKGVHGPTVLTPTTTIKGVNVTVTGQGNAAMLKDPAKLRWPVGLQTLSPATETKELRAQIDNLYAKARLQAMDNELDAALIKDLERSLTKMGQFLVADVDDLSFTDFTDGKHFLKDLKDGVTILKRPNAKNFVDGKYAAKGRTVQELVNYLTEHGLRFGPATAGNEAAYNALYQAMLAYDEQTNAMYAGGSSFAPPLPQ
jgi:hypothetical protein